MPDYKEIYLTLFHATEQTINTLITAQNVCEELYIPQCEPNLNVISLSTEHKNSMEKE